MSIMNLKMALSILSAIFAIVAAVLWWLSAIVKTPSKFPIVATYNTTSCDELQTLANALIRQSRLSACAAIFAAISAAFQAALIAF